MSKIDNNKSITGICLVIVLSTILWSCSSSSEPDITHIQARAVTPTLAIEAGRHPLGLGGLRIVNRTLIRRDGVLYIPKKHSSETPMPLLVWLHGGGGRADSFEYMFPLAEEFGVVLLLLDARHNTWDGIDSPFGPDVLFIDAALQYIFQRVAINPHKIALGGISDGASYALALGRVNGNLFTHLIAVAPGRLALPAPPIKQPKIFVAHGIQDNVYNVLGSRHFIVPRLKSSGYDVTYLEFDGPHWVPAPVAQQILKWLSQENLKQKQ